jgi:hypothetical protein
MLNEELENKNIIIEDFKEKEYNHYLSHQSSILKVKSSYNHSSISSIDQASSNSDNEDNRVFNLLNHQKNDKIQSRNKYKTLSDEEKSQ